MTLATEDSLSLTWTVPPGSVVDIYQLNWDIQHTELAQFMIELTPARLNNYTITGLGSYGNASLAVSVTAINAVGNKTSPKLIFETDFASQGDSEDSNQVLIIGAVLSGCVGIALLFAAVMAGLARHYKKKYNARHGEINCVRNQYNTELSEMNCVGDDQLPSDGESEDNVRSTGTTIEVIANE